MGRSTVYNHIVTKEKIDAVNPENIELGEDWLDYLQSIDRSPQSIAAYRNDLKIFWVWNCEYNKNKFFTDLTKREVAKFQNHAINTWRWSPNRIRRVKSCLSSLSNYIENVLDDEEEFENFKPIIRKIENPVKNAVREKTVLSDNEVENLLSVLMENKEYEKACCIAIAAYSGMRKSELLQMKVSFFNEEHFVYDAMWKTDKIRTKGFGKLGHQMSKFVLYGAKPYIDAWMNYRHKNGIKSEWMFVVRRKDNDAGYVYEQRKDLDSWTDEISDILKKPFYYHCLRHFTCSRLHRLNLPSHVIQEFFGWASSEMLQIYNDITAEDEFEKYFDKNGIKEQTQGSLSDV